MRLALPPLKESRILLTEFPSLSLDQPLVRKTQRAVKKQAAIAANEKLPITLELLNKLISHIAEHDSNAFTSLRDSLFFSLAFRGCVRGDDLVHMRWAHIEEVDQGVRIFIPYTKTTPFGQGLFARVTDESGKIKHALNLLRQLQEETSPGCVHVFTQFKSKSEISLNTMRKTFISHLQHIIGDDAKDYGLHSLRRGGATHAFRLGVNIEDIMAHGRWTSHAAKRYIVLPDEDQWLLLERHDPQEESSDSDPDDDLDSDVEPQSFGQYELDHVPCSRCQKSGWSRNNQLLLCDGDNCPAMWHMKCLQPALSSVPKGAWFCPACTESHRHRAQRAKR